MAWSLAWAPSGTHLAWLSDEEPGAPIYVGRYPSGQVREFSRPDFSPGRIAMAPDGQRLAAAGAIGEQPAVVIWDLKTGAELASLPGMARIAFAPDGRHLFAVRGGGVSIEEGVGDAIHVWAIGASAAAHTIPAFPRDADGAHYVAGLGVSPNGRFLVAVSESGSVRLWDTATQ